MTTEDRDLLIRVRKGDGVAPGYRVDAELGDGSRFGGGTLRLDGAGLLAAINDSPRYGELLFESLFAGPGGPTDGGPNAAAGAIRRAYEAAMGSGPPSVERPVRIRLLIEPDAAELHALRWERLYHRLLGTWVPLSASADTPFSRYVPLEVAEPRPVATLPIRMLFVAADPTGLPTAYPQVDVNEQIDAFRQGVRAASRTDEVQVTILPGEGRSRLRPDLRAALIADGFEIADGPSTLAALLRLLPGSHVLHFVGHGHLTVDPDGSARTALFFERDDGSWQAVTDSQLVERLVAIDAAPSLVFLAACESASGTAETAHPFVGLAPRLVAAGIPAVVAMQDIVPMETTRTLTLDFYRHLMEHGLVDVALAQSRRVLFDDERLDWTVPILFTRLRRGRLLVPQALANRVVAADLVLTPEPEHGAIADRLPPPIPLPQLRPAPVLLLPRDFPQLIGRDGEVSAAMTAIGNRDLFEFYGPAGSGKTSLVRHLTHRLAGTPGEGIIHLPYGSRPLDDLVQYLFDALYEADASLRPTDAELHRLLQDRSPVIAVDDADLSRDDVERLAGILPHAAFLLAASDRNVWGEGRAVPLAGVALEAAVRLFERELGRPVSADERPAVERLCTALRGHPLHILQAAERAASGAWPVTAVADDAGPGAVMPGDAAVGSLDDRQRQVLAVVAAASAPIDAGHIGAVTGDPDVISIAESLRRRGLVKAASPRYTLAEPLSAASVARLDIGSARQALLEHLATWAEENSHSPGSLVQDLDVILGILGRPADPSDSPAVLRLARASEGALIVAKRWGTWVVVLRRELGYATAAGDRAGEAWALHQLGTRALGLQETEAARASLSRALAIRQGLGDSAGAAATRHNLQILGGPPPPPRDRPDRPPRPRPEPIVAPPIPAPPRSRNRSAARWLAFATLVIAAIAGGKALYDRTVSAPVTAGGPVVRIDPAEVRFGTLVIGSRPSTITVTLANDGPGALVVKRAALAQPVAGISIADRCRQPVAPGTSCAISITFSPVTAGTLRGELRVEDASGLRDLRIPVSGDAVLRAGRAAVVFEPAAVDAGSIAVGSETSVSVTVVNAGTADLAIDRVALSAPGAFSLTRMGCGRSLAPGARCGVRLAFRPAVPGPAAQDLVITDDTAGSHRVPLTGVGVAATPNLVAVLDTKGVVTVADDGTVSLPVIITVSNTGAGDAGRFAVSTQVRTVEGAGETVVPFAPDEDDGVADTLKAFTSRPLAPDQRVAITGRILFGREWQGRQVVITALADSCAGEETPDPGCRVKETDERDNVSNSLQLAIGARVGVPEIAFDPATVDVGSAVVDGEALTDLRVTSTGDADLSIASVAFPDGSPFSVVETDCVRTLPPNASCTVRIAFRPTVAGDAKADLSVVDDTADGPHLVRVTGIGTAPPATEIVATRAAHHRG